MTDNWDDDDFGTFESADLNKGSAPSSATVNTSTNLPAWLLEAQAKPPISPTHQRDEPNHTAKASNYEQLSLPTSVASIFDSTNTSVTSEEATGDTGHDTVSATIASPAVTEYAFNAVFSDATSAHSTLSTEEKGSVFVKKEKEKKAEEQKKESDLVVQLRGQLDSAMALKEQSEMSLNELREELNHKVEELNKKIKRKEEEHSIMMMQLEEKKSKELEQLQQSSENTMREVTEQYTTLCNQVAAD
uniref:Transforming acidic coiled-coil-containing protein C-terminal domain-containing protein n=3 Tax=Ciona intestinalis TaxID=7719 RepID=H2XT79_CIOIN